MTNILSLSCSFNPLKNICFFFGRIMSNKIRQLYEFADFRFDAEQLSLWQNGELVLVPPKALQILKLLVEQQGEIVSREELLEKVWHDTFVEEANINYTISLLRKALGNNNFVQTVSKRGYRFVAEVTITSADSNISNSQDLIIKPFIIAKKTRWIFASILILAVISLTTYAFWGRNSKNLSSTNQPPNSNEAQQAYTRGKMILEDKDTPKRNEKAIDEFQKAITLDPTFALGYAGLAEGFAAQGKRLSKQESLEYYAKAKAAAQKALNLNENSAEAYSVLGWIKFIGDWDWTGAENDLKRAIQLKPNDAIAHYRYSQLLTAIGNNAEAIEEIKKASELDPISEFILTGNFIVLEQSGNFAESTKLAEKYWRENKENHSALRAYTSALFNQGEYAKVIENGENVLAKNQKQIPWLSLLATAYHKTVNIEKADEMLNELKMQSQTNTKALHALATNYAEIGRNDEAIIALQKCLEQREERMIWIKNEPRLANLRNDARFQEILKKMRLN